MPQAPWEKYQAAAPATADASGPWAKYQQPTQPDVSVTLDYGNGNRTFVDSAVDFVKGFSHSVNPLPALKAIYDDFEQHVQSGPKTPFASVNNAVAGAQTAGDVLGGLAGAQLDQFKKGYQAFKEGRYSEAVGHTVAGALPLVGPAAANAGEKIGEGNIAEGLGEGAGLIAPIAAAPALRGRSLRAPGLSSKLNPVEQAAVQFAEREGIPVDAATRTGSRVTRQAQKLLSDSPGGSGVAARARQAQNDALAATAERLKNRVEPGLGANSYTKETAAESVADAAKQRIERFGKKANEAYTELRRIEAEPRNQVNIADTPEALAAREEQAFNMMVDDTVKTRMDNLVEEVRGGATEMTGKTKRESVDPFDQGKIIGRFGGGFSKMWPELEGLSETPGVIARAVETGHGKVFERVKEAFRKSTLENEGGEIRVALRDVELPPGEAQNISLPVNMRPVKEALKPIYEELTRKWPVFQQQNSRGLKALDNIINGEDVLSASEADANLSAIKALQREAKDARSIGVVTKAVREMDLAVRGAVAKGGPDALSALNRGRALTRAKYEAKDVLKSIRAADDAKFEPVQTFNLLTAGNDTRVTLLRRVAQQVPQELPKLGRAWLEGLFETAKDQGGFGHADRLFNDWQRLGGESKKLMFKDPALVKDLDNFFLVAKKMAENPNPSGTGSAAQLIAHGGLLVANPILGTSVIVGQNALARMLFSPRGSRLLTTGLKVPLAHVPRAAAIADQIIALAGKDARPLDLAPGVAQNEKQ